MSKRSREENESLAQYIMRDCKERGLDHFFGIPGSGSPMDIMDAARANGVDFVIMGHESSAVFAAAYYGLFKRTAGLFVGIKGVGAGNAVGGAVNATTERVPVVVILEARSTAVPHTLPLAQHTGEAAGHAPFFGDMIKHAGTFSRANVAAE